MPKKEPQRAQITPVHKKLICKHAAESKNKTLQQITDWFNKHHNSGEGRKPIARATVGKILNKKEKWLAVDEADQGSHKPKQRPPKYPDLDKAQNEFVKDVSESLCCQRLA